MHKNPFKMITKKSRIQNIYQVFLVVFYSKKKKNLFIVILRYLPVTPMFTYQETKLKKMKNVLCKKQIIK